MTQKEILELQERRMTERVQQRVERSPVRRFTMIGGVLAAILAGFITMTVREIRSDARVELAAARKLQETSAEELGKAAREARKVSQRATAAEQILADIRAEAQRELQDLSQQTRSLRERLASAAENSLGITSDIRDEMAELTKRVLEISDVVETLAVESESSQLADSVSGIKSSAKDVEDSLDKYRTNIDRARQEASLIVYTVYLDDNVENRGKYATVFSSSGFSLGGYATGKDFTGDLLIDFSAIVYLTNAHGALHYR